jgi:excisionase family DNA binding protein
MTIEILHLEEAAQILRAHKETVRLKAKRGEIPARKVGKRWIFSQLALNRYLMGELPMGAVEAMKENYECHSTSEVTKVLTGCISYPIPTEASQYREALAPRTKRKQKSFMTA